MQLLPYAKLASLPLAFMPSPPLLTTKQLLLLSLYTHAAAAKSITFCMSIRESKVAASPLMAELLKHHFYLSSSRFINNATRNRRRNALVTVPLYVIDAHADIDGDFSCGLCRRETTRNAR